MNKWISDIYKFMLSNKNNFDLVNMITVISSMRSFVYDKNNG